MKPFFVPWDTRFLGSSEPEPGAPGEAAAAALFGAPLDLTESFRSGTHGGPAAVRFMSEALETYSSDLDRDLEDLDLRDLGNLQLDGLSMELALAAVADAMAHAVRTARLGVMIGGEHTASLAGFRGMTRLYPDALLIQADAHLDIRESYDGRAVSHASWLFHAGQELGFDRIIQVGLRSGERAEWQRSRAKVAYSSSGLVLPPAIRQLLTDHPVYLSIDIDVLDPAHAPGTGCPEPGGVTFRELLGFLHGLAGIHVMGMDVMEVSPNLDPSNITAAAGAKLIREAILLFGDLPSHVPSAV